MVVPQIRSHKAVINAGKIIIIYTIWLFNIAMENPVNKWRFIAGLWPFSMAMLNNQRVIWLKFEGLTRKNNEHWRFNSYKWHEMTPATSWSLE